MFEPLLNSAARWGALLVLVLSGVFPGCVFSNPTSATSPEVPSGVPAEVMPAPPPATRSKAPRLVGPLTLDRAIELALAGNPAIAAAGHDTDVALAGRDVTFGEALPKFGIAGGAIQHLNQQRLIAPRRNGELGVFSDQQVFAGLVVSLPLFTGGRITRRIEAADLLAAAARRRGAGSLARGRRSSSTFRASSTGSWPRSTWSSLSNSPGRRLRNT